MKFLPKDRDFNDFLTEFQAESDRAAAVLGAAYLDDLLSVLLKATFIEDAPAVEELLDDSRLLGNFSTKIRLAFVLGLISLQEHNDLHRIRKIRNLFAHQRSGVFYERAPVNTHCRAFETIEERFRAEPALGEVYPNEPRLLFDLAVALLAYYMIRRGHNARRVAAPQPVLWEQYDLPDEQRPRGPAA